jgi:hypothetical protein
VSPDDPRHGTRRGYYAHRRDNEDACTDCKRAAAGAEARYQMNRANGLQARVPAIGTQRRLQALAAMGYTWRALDRHLNVGNMCEKWVNEQRGYVYATTANRVAAMYERLSMTFPPETNQYERMAASRARSLARRKGWPPPLAWDDIDDPAARPHGIPTPTRKEASEWLVEDWDLLRRHGYTRRAAAEYMGITKKRLEKAIERQSRRLKEAS